MDTAPTLLRLDAAPREALRAVLASYLGHFRHADAHKLTLSLWRRYPWLNEIFALSPQDKFRVGTVPTLQLLWEPPSVASFIGQWRWFCKRRRGELILIQAGNRVIAGNQDAQRLAELLRLPLDATPRAGFSATLSLPLRGLQATRARLRKHGVAHCFIAEEGHLKHGFKRRVLRLIWRPATESLQETGNSPLTPTPHSC